MPFANREMGPKLINCEMSYKEQVEKMVSEVSFPRGPLACPRLGENGHEVAVESYRRRRGMGENEAGQKGKPAEETGKKGPQAGRGPRSPS